MSDCWIEFKYMPHIPRSTGIQPDLSAKQRQWINKRHDEGRNVAVILGCPDGGVIYTNREWDEPLDTPSFVERMLPRRQLAAWIEGVTCAGFDLSWRPPR